MLVVHPTGTHAEVEATPGHLVDGGGVLGDDRRMTKRDGGHQDTEADGGGVPGETGEDGKGVCGIRGGVSIREVVIAACE